MGVHPALQPADRRPACADPARLGAGRTGACGGQPGHRGTRSARFDDTGQIAQPRQPRGHRGVDAQRRRGQAERRPRARPRDRGRRRGAARICAGAVRNPHSIPADGAQRRLRAWRLALALRAGGGRAIRLERAVAGAGRAVPARHPRVRGRRQLREGDRDFRARHHGER